MQEHSKSVQKASNSKSGKNQRMRRDSERQVRQVDKNLAHIGREGGVRLMNPHPSLLVTVEVV